MEPEAARIPLPMASQSEELIGSAMAKRNVSILLWYEDFLAAPSEAMQHTLDGNL
jgi:hypothetical protein